MGIWGSQMKLVVLLGVAATFAAFGTSMDVDEVIPEATRLLEASKPHMLGLHRRQRSATTHAALTEFITHTHTREVHPMVLIDGDQKLVSETKLNNADMVEYYVMQREGTCKTGIAIMDLSLPGSHKTAILGDTFLRSFYSVYNHERNEVGFAKANHQHTETIPLLIEENVAED